TGVRYRNLKSRVKTNDLHRFEAEVQRWVDAYVSLENRLNKHLAPTAERGRLKKNVTPDELSREVRAKLDFAESEPIPSVVEVLEKFGVRVLEQPTDLRIDGLAAKYDKEYVVVLNPMVSNDRGRLNGAHELGHVLLGDCDSDGTETKEAEKRAFDFASH